MMRQQCDLGWLRETVGQLSKAIKVLPLTAADVACAIHATERYRMHYWDAQIWAVARSHGISAIFTEDGPIGQTIEGVAYVNPLG